MSHPSSRPTLIMLPPLPCGADFYAQQIEALSDLADPKVMVLDEPSLTECAAAVLAAGPSRFLLAGAAHGGSLAIEIAVTAPDRIAGLWLMNCNPAPHPDPEGARLTSARARAGEFEVILDEWAEYIVAEDADMARNLYLEMARAAGPDRFAKQYEAAARRPDNRNNLGRITAPTLLLWGEDDVLVPLEVGKRMAEAIPMAQFVTLPGCGHLPAIEQPRATNSAARSWLTDSRALAS
jgi:pimeloyl-ACP methyl ester carboxylesterase